MLDTTQVIPTVTLQEAASFLRARGLRTSATRVGDGIEQGVYPFGVCIKREGNRTFEIYERLLEEWAAERESKT